MSAALLDAPDRTSSRPATVGRIVEFRQYTLVPGQRDALIELFESQLIEAQEECGIELLGQFRDLDDPDRFVWLRGFADPPGRASALAAFYGGACWKANRDAANATMIDSDDVLLLRSAEPGASGLRLARREDGEGGSGIVLASIHHLAAGHADDFADFFERAMVPLLWNASVDVAARFRSAQVPNDFPALPVREHDTVFVWLSRHASVARAEQAQARIVEALDWSTTLAAELAALQMRSETLRLAPTPRSRLHG